MSESTRNDDRRNGYENEFDDAVVDTEHHEETAVVTAGIKGEPGYIAYVEDEYNKVRATGETRWEAVYHLAIAKAGEQR